MTANTFVMVLWREVCLVPQVTFWKGNAPHEGFLSVSALYLYLYLQYVPPIIHSGQNPFPRNKLPLLAIRFKRWDNFFVKRILTNLIFTILQSTWWRAEHDVPLLRSQCASTGRCHDDCCCQGNFYHKSWDDCKLEHPAEYLFAEWKLSPIIINRQTGLIEYDPQSKSSSDIIMTVRYEPK